jgi:hypothetical protein
VDDDAPPILRRGGNEPAKSTETKPSDSKPTEAKPGDKSSAEKPVDSTKAQGKDSAAPSSSEKASAPPSTQSSGTVLDRPLLRRSKPGDAPQKFEDKDFSATVPIKDRLLAVSDAAGPDPRPYRMERKPDEILAYNQKALELASQAVVSLYPAMKVDGAATVRGKKSTPHIFKFINSQMQVFDLTSSNDPVIVFTATVDPSEKIAATAGKLTVTVVARLDIYGELRKLLAEATDDHHLDLNPRLEFVDAIDVEGDANGELVFREISDNAQGFVVYRAGLDRVWPIFDSVRNY